MKKALAVILTLVLALSIIACAKKEDPGVASKPEADGTVYEWSLSCEYSAENHQTVALEAAAKKIEEATGGKIKITVFPSMALGDYTVVYGQVMTGDIEMAACPISSQYDPRVDVMTLPYLSSTFEEFEQNYMAKDSYMWKLFEDITSAQGVKLLGFLNAGFMGIGAKKVDKEDFSFLTGPEKKSTLMRCPGGEAYIQTMQAMNYNTTTIPYSDLYSALQSGLCDGWLGGSGLVNYDSFRDAISYFIDCNCINETIPVMMNAELFKSLSEEYQTIIIDAFNEAQIRVNNERKDQEAQAVVDMEAYGIKVIQPTEEELLSLRDSIRAIVWPNMAASLGQEVIDDICKIYNVTLP
ncbi:MAG: TRAP transporter substrate-binding protein DctP [Saccharofermentanales bacterium]